MMKKSEIANLNSALNAQTNIIEEDDDRRGDNYA